jgi:hypothetical protein
MAERGVEFENLLDKAIASSKIDSQMNLRSRGLWLLATFCRREANRPRAFQL